MEDIQFTQMVVLVPTSLYIFTSKTYVAFSTREEFDRKNMQYFKDRSEYFDDDYYPCVRSKRRNCNLQHVYNWIKLFVY